MVNKMSFIWQHDFLFHTPIVLQCNVYFSADVLESLAATAFVKAKGRLFCYQKSNEPSLSSLHGIFFCAARLFCLFHTSWNLTTIAPCHTRCHECYTNALRRVRVFTILIDALTYQHCTYRLRGFFVSSKRHWILLLVTLVITSVNWMLWVRVFTVRI